MVSRFLKYLLLAFIAIQPCTIAGPKPTQVVARSFDIDDNILFDMFSTIDLVDPKTGQVLKVSTEQWATVRGIVGKDPQTPEQKNVVQQLTKGKSDWKTFAADKNTFLNFGDESKEGGEIFANHMRKLVKLPAEQWQRKSFKALQSACKTLEGVRNTYFITAREHAPETLRKGFEVLHEVGLIEHIPPLENFYPVGWKGWLTKEPRYYAPPGNPGPAKANVMLDVLDKMQKTPVPKDATPVRDAWGNELKPVHLWGFSDDDRGNFEKAMEVLRQAQKDYNEAHPNVGGKPTGRWPNVKPMVFHDPPVGDNEVKVIMPDGETREPKADESKYIKSPSGKTVGTDPVKAFAGVCAEKGLVH